MGNIKVGKHAGGDESKKVNFLLEVLNRMEHLEFNKIEI